MESLQLLLVFASLLQLDLVDVVMHGTVIFALGIEGGDLKLDLLEFKLLSDLDAIGQLEGEIELFV